MSMDKKPDKKKPAVVTKQEAAAIKERHKEDFKSKPKVDVTLSKEAMTKLKHLIPQLRKDAKYLGIQQLSVQIVPQKNLDYLAMVEGIDYKVVDDGYFVVPREVTFSLPAVEMLSEEELRAIAWHEFGHIVYWYYFPESAIKDEDEDHYVVQETFCDEFAYRKHGDLVLSAQLKLDAIEKEKGRTGILQTIYAMRRFKQRYGKHEYWLNLADTLGIMDEIKYDPTKSGVIGFKPRRNILKGMYHKKH